MLMILVILLAIVALVLGILQLIYFIQVLMRMFSNDESTLGIICIVLTLCSGFGPLLTYIMGWVKMDKLQTQAIMPKWTTYLVAQLVITVLLMILLALLGPAN
ncbi:hypothetical protein [Blastopirellula retiformator]|uniref:Uncharacterized protein n=1 Tax=Blastopirellula retiformator TaxID=2527970 RepID=A0A5C5UUA5_9BACT|nr:hypothetical protein [Blastopirellula retiformator]TWT30014.1 hypothetical protein Enr8_46710 [Blastopirellula retiformator]